MKSLHDVRGELRANRRRVRQIVRNGGTWSPAHRGLQNKLAALVVLLPPSEQVAEILAQHLDFEQAAFEATLRGGMW